MQKKQAVPGQDDRNCTVTSELHKSYLWCSSPDTSAQAGLIEATKHQTGASKKTAGAT